MWSPLGTWPTTQACALTGNRTRDPLVCSPCSIHWATPARSHWKSFLSWVFPIYGSLYLSYLSVRPWSFVGRVVMCSATLIFPIEKKTYSPAYWWKEQSSVLLKENHPSHIESVKSSLKESNGKNKKGGKNLFPFGNKFLLFKYKEFCSLSYMQMVVTMEP